ncbi:hypothetical protein H1P_3650008 [Hyella patelloides LEGE 07179]|uniref:Uncharacterized protein n=1 Tax=Hyella patelloides LEGE 07179 TaxID=945734 RepID=A0A563VWF2_9CYAN|nr:hypothetical protein H1P_3650008 [Hyella patelloides LEGE 07179]
MYPCPLPGMTQHILLRARLDRPNYLLVMSTLIVRVVVEIIDNFFI